MISVSCIVDVFGICVRGSKNKDISSITSYIAFKDFFMDTPHLRSTYKYIVQYIKYRCSDHSTFLNQCPKCFVFSLSSCDQCCDESSKMTSLCSLDSGGCHLDHDKATLTESRALHGEGLGRPGVSLVEVIVIVMVGHPETSIWKTIQLNIKRQLHSLHIRPQSRAPQIKGWLWPTVSKAILKVLSLQMSTLQGDGCQGSLAPRIEDTLHWDGRVCWSPIQLPARVTFWPSPAPKDDGTTHSRSGPAPFKGAHKTKLGQRQKTMTKTKDNDKDNDSCPIQGCTHN